MRPWRSVMRVVARPTVDMSLSFRPGEIGRLELRKEAEREIVSDRKQRLSVGISAFVHVGAATSLSWSALRTARNYGKQSRGKTKHILTFRQPRFLGRFGDCLRLRCILLIASTARYR